MSEFTEQAKALDQMSGDVLDLIEEHGAEFRAIINDYKFRLGRCPSAEELVSEASKNAGRDLRK